MSIADLLILSNHVQSVNAVKYTNNSKRKHKVCIKTTIEVSETIIEANNRYSTAPRFCNVNLLYLRGIKRKKHLFYDIYTNSNSTEDEDKILNVFKNVLLYALVLFPIKAFKLIFFVCF